jgi:hypothetical protein
MKKGGSIASDAVAKSLVSESTYDAMSKNFSNHTNAAKCGGKRAKKVVKPAAKKPKVAAKKPVVASKKPVVASKKGGNMISNVSNAVTKALSSTLNIKGPQVSEGFNVFKSVPAAAGAEYANLRGYNSKGGQFQTKNLSHYMNNSSSYVVKNRRGGAAVNVAKDSAGLDYSAVPTLNKMQGNVGVRATPEAVDRYIATSPVTTNQPLTKSAEFGSVQDSAHYFSYASPQKIIAGGKKKCPTPKKK